MKILQPVCGIVLSGVPNGKTVDMMLGAKDGMKYRQGGEAYGKYERLDWGS